MKNDDGKSKGGSGRQDKLRFRQDEAHADHSRLPAFVLLFLLIGYIYIITNYTVTTVHVEGNIHYTDEEIMEMVMSGAYGDNSLLLALKYRDKGIDERPFYPDNGCDHRARDTIRISVYEKALAG